MSTFCKYQFVRTRDVFIVSRLRKTSFFYDGSDKSSHSAFKCRAIRFFEDKFKVRDLPLDIRILLREILDN